MKLQINSANVTLGGNEILNNINFEINDGEKIAIIGRNGSGKTTLLRLIAGEIEPDFVEGQTIPTIGKTGRVDIGYLHQISFEDENETLEAEIQKIFKQIYELKEKLQSLEKQLATNPSEKLLNQYIATQHNYELVDGYALEKLEAQAFKKFGFQEADKQKKLCEFSGGQKTKIALIKLLFLKPDVLILDEPTNHLDTEAIVWLEDYLKSYKKAVVVVSHDREFIDNVASIVYEIEHKTITKYAGNYTEFVKIKEDSLIKAQKDYEAYTAEVNRLQTLADKFRYKATKASMAQSKLKQIERMEVVEAPQKPNEKNFHFSIIPKVESGLEVLKLDRLKYGYTTPLSEVSAKIYKGDRIAVVGGNGTGKSTLLKTIVVLVPLLGGKIKLGQNVEIGYFDQQTITMIESEENVLESFLTKFPDFSTEEARTKLGAFLFSKDDVFKSVNSLSGGERVRLELAKIFNTHPNFLILDEPTNHMDIAGRERLESILEKYEGTLLFVSHDRYFVKKLARGIISVQENESVYYKDTDYSEFVKKTKKKEVFAEPVKIDVVANREAKSPNNYLKQKERQKKLSKLERDIEKSEARIEELKAQYLAPENCSNVVVLMKLQEELDAEENKYNNLMQEWMDLN